MKGAFYREFKNFLECSSLLSLFFPLMTSKARKSIISLEIDIRPDILESSHAYQSPSAACA